MFLMESVSQSLMRADVTHSVDAYVSVARPEPASSAGARSCGRPGLATKVDHLDPAVAAVETAG